jgi:hypothetical protein
MECERREQKGGSQREGEVGVVERERERENGVEGSEREREGARGCKRERDGARGRERVMLKGGSLREMKRGRERERE